MSGARFQACLQTVLAHEGGYVDHPRDPGGATNLGITRATLAAWRGLAVADLPKAEVKSLGLEEAAAIYRARYWTRCGCDDLPAGLDLVVFDSAVNSGPGRSVGWLQAVLGVPVDGEVGPVTKASISARPVPDLLRAVLARRRAFLRRLPTWPVFGRGWTRRLRNVETAALAAARQFPPPRNLNSVPHRPETGVSRMIQTLLQTVLGGVLMKEVRDLTEAVLETTVADPAARERIRRGLSEAVKAREPEIAADLAEAAAAGDLEGDLFVKRARPTFLYVVYAMVFGAVPFGILYGLAPDFSGRFVEGMRLFLQAIPDLGWYLFGSAYLGYAGLRSWDKKNGKAS